MLPQPPRAPLGRPAAPQLVKPLVKPRSAFPKDLYFFYEKSTGVAHFHVESSPDGQFPVEQAAGLLAMHCMVRGQTPADYVVMVRAEEDPLRQLPAVKAAIWTINKNQPISKAQTLDQILAESLARRRLYMVLLGFFSGAALLLAAIGVYGVVSYSVSKRTHEMGIRLAIGAERRHVLRLVLGHGVKMALVGIATGIVAALALTRLMSSLLFGVSATDPLTFAGVATLLTVVALFTSYIPARRAMRIDPMVALRSE